MTSNLSERITDVRNSVRLSSVINEYVKLERRGNEYAGCCPFHEDHTPSFYCNDQKGVYHCFGCGAAGNVVDFVKGIEGLSVSEACERLEGGFTPHVSAPQYSRKPAETEEFAREIWRSATSIIGTPAETYLLKRGIPLSELPQQENLRFARLSYDRSASAHPVLIAAVRNLNREVVGVQRIYLTEEGEKLCATGSKRTLGSISGNTVWLHEDPHFTCDFNSHIFICEGLEDGLSLLRMSEPDEERHVWVCGGAGMMKNIAVPKGTEKVTIAVDNDEAGRNSGMSLAKRLIAEGHEVKIIGPDPRFKDFNEHLVYWQQKAGSREDDTPWGWEYYHG